MSWRIRRWTRTRGLCGVERCGTVGLRWPQVHISPPCVDRKCKSKRLCTWPRRFGMPLSARWSSSWIQNAGCCSWWMNKWMNGAITPVILNLGQSDCSNRIQAPNPCPNTKLKICGDYYVGHSNSWLNTCTWVADGKACSEEWTSKRERDITYVLKTTQQELVCFACTCNPWIKTILTVSNRNKYSNLRTHRLVQIVVRCVGLMRLLL